VPGDRPSGGADPNLGHGVAALLIDQGEVLEGLAVPEAEILRIHLDQVTGLGDDRVLGLPDRVGTRPAHRAHPFAFALPELPALLEPIQHAAHHGDREDGTLLGQQDLQLGFAPPRVLEPQHQRCLNLGQRPARMSNAVGSMAAVLQATQAIPPIPALPAVKARAAPAEAAAGQADVPAMLLVPAQHGQARTG